jgi:hypothetical protein
MSPSPYRAYDMKRFVNLEEHPQKTVGLRRPPVDSLEVSKADTQADAQAWHTAFGGTGIPKGVYRFRTHEEADQWLWKMITRRR